MSKVNPSKNRTPRTGLGMMSATYPLLMGEFPGLCYRVYEGLWWAIILGIGITIFPTSTIFHGAVFWGVITSAELISQFLSPGCHQVCVFYPHCWLISPQKPMVAPPPKIADRKCRLRRWQSSTGPVVWVSRGRSQQPNPWGKSMGKPSISTENPMDLPKFSMIPGWSPHGTMVHWAVDDMLQPPEFFNIYRSPPQHVWQVNIYR